MERIVTLLAAPATVGAFHRQYRLMGLDGFVVDLPDSQIDDRLFERPKSGRDTDAFPQVRVLWRNLVKPCRRGETTMAPACCDICNPKYCCSEIAAFSAMHWSGR